MKLLSPQNIFFDRLTLSAVYSFTEDDDLLHLFWFMRSVLTTLYISFSVFLENLWHWSFTSLLRISQLGISSWFKFLGERAESVLYDVALYNFVWSPTISSERIIWHWKFHKFYALYYNVSASNNWIHRIMLSRIKIREWLGRESWRS